MPVSPLSACCPAPGDFPKIDDTAALNDHIPVIKIDGRIAMAGDQAQFLTQQNAAGSLRWLREAQISAFFGLGAIRWP